MRLACLLSVAAVLWLAPGVGRADELLLLDGIMTTDEAENGFYWFGVPPANPGDWTSPGDYAGGEWHARYEIIVQPAWATHLAPTGLQSCVWQDGKGGDFPETCSSVHFLDGPGSVTYSVEAPAGWWEKADSQASAAPFDWSRGADFVDLGSPTWHRNPDGSRCLATIAAWGGCEENLDAHLPMTLRLSIVLVSAGATFSGWEQYGLGPGGPDAGDGAPEDGDGGVLADADGGLEPDADGATEPDGDGAAPDGGAGPDGDADAGGDVGGDADGGQQPDGDAGAEDGGTDGDSAGALDGGCGCGAAAGSAGPPALLLVLGLWAGGARGRKSRRG